MKFVLGYMKTATSSTGRQVKPRYFLTVRAHHEGREFYFERFERTDGGVQLPRLKVYDSQDYPDAMLKHLIESCQILPLEKWPFAASPLHQI